jgi:hypothetical protein
MVARYMMTIFNFTLDESGGDPARAIEISRELSRALATGATWMRFHAENDFDRIRVRENASAWRSGG